MLVFIIENEMLLNGKEGKNWNEGEMLYVKPPKNILSISIQLLNNKTCINTLRGKGIKQSPSHLDPLTMKPNISTFHSLLIQRG